MLQEVGVSVSGFPKAALPHSGPLLCPLQALPKLDVLEDLHNFCIQVHFTPTLLPGHRFMTDMYLSKYLSKYLLDSCHKIIEISIGYLSYICQIFA